MGFLKSEEIETSIKTRSQCFVFRFRNEARSDALFSLINFILSKFATSFLETLKVCCVSIIVFSLIFDCISLENGFAVWHDCGSQSIESYPGEYKLYGQNILHLQHSRYTRVF